jgi:AraC-like DNA-binding protein
MIKEKSSYTVDLPVNIRIVEIDEYPLHFHQDIEFVFVLKGEINLKCGYFTYAITEGNVFTINGREVHGLYRTEQGNIVALVQIDNYYFSHYFSRLSGSCFRTFTNDKNDERLDALRYYFVNILLENIKKEPGYKRQIVDLTVRLLAYLEEFFHYFSFENKVVVNTRNDNPVSVERLGRIINYIYEKHAEKLTLEDLGKLEHLSTYYISHLITDSTGMNFRDFLCFARVEFSEMILLDTNKKINVIAQEVGFSATSYYIKYFKKWFGMTPDEYRKKYFRDTKAPNIPAKLNQAEPGAVSRILHKNLEAFSKQTGGTVSSGSFQVEFHADCQAAPLGRLDAVVVPRCKASILTERLETVIGLTRELNIREISVNADHATDTAMENLRQRLEQEGIRIRSEQTSLSPQLPMFGMDSMAAASCILKQGLTPGCREITLNSIVDGSENYAVLKGEDGIFTADLIPKPSYFAYKMLRHMNGELIHWGKYHAIVRKNDQSSGKCSWCIVCYNHSEEIESLCRRPSSAEETAERIRNFTDTLDVGIHLDGIFGPHQIIIYRQSPENSIFHFSMKNGISRRLMDDEGRILTWSVSPKVDISTEALSGSMFLSVSLKGLEAQCIMIVPLKTDGGSERR